MTRHACLLKELLPFLNRYRRGAGKCRGFRWRGHSCWRGCRRLLLLTASPTSKRQECPATISMIMPRCLIHTISTPLYVYVWSIDPTLGHVKCHGAGRGQQPHPLSGSVPAIPQTCAHAPAACRPAPRPSRYTTTTVATALKTQLVTR
jgi:hypothetical protein